jgi:hypothetical protein
MKKSKFIKQVLKSKDNTVFVNADQVANAIDLFEKLGMLPPEIAVEIPDSDTGCIEEGSQDIYINKWET